jgi:hypothetical protein
MTHALTAANVYRRCKLQRESMALSEDRFEMPRPPSSTTSSVWRPPRAREASVDSGRRLLTRTLKRGMTPGFG